MLTIVFWIHAEYQRRLTKNKLTLRPYLFMMGFFLSLMILDNLIVFMPEGHFVHLSIAYTFYVFDFMRLFFCLAAFGTQLYEWQLLSSMIAF